MEPAAKNLSNQTARVPTWVRTARALLLPTALAVGCAPERAAGPTASARTPLSRAVDSAAIRAQWAAGQAARGARTTVGKRGSPRFAVFKTWGSDTTTYDPTSVHCATNCDGDAGTTGAITVTLPRLAVSVRITSNGPFKCGGTLPVVRAYDQSGYQVASGTMSIVNPADCAVGNDDMSSGQQLQLSTSGLGLSIAYLVISPPAPWTFQVPSSYDPATTITARTKLDYDVVLVDGSPEPACDLKADTLLAASAALRQGLLKAVRNSRWTEAENLRQEQLGALVRHSDGSFESFALTPASASNCGITLSDANKAFIAADSVVAVYHSHPYRPGDSLTCTTNGKTETETYDPIRKTLNSTSDALLTTATTSTRLGQGRPPADFYYIDAQNAYRIPATTSLFKAIDLANGTIVKHEGCQF